MARRSRAVLFLATLAIVASLVVLASSGLDAGGVDGSRVTVTVVDDNGTQLTTVEARVANTSRERYVGLSETESLAPGTGMLFVHPSVGTHAYVMRNMSFPLDMVFADASGRITTIHHASVPPADVDRLHRYRGRGKYVLEVPRGWANETGVAVGDRLQVPPSVT
ncbi:MAG: DUF192 domain-containing protein [Haloarculaceae archaeon]